MEEPPAKRAKRTDSAAMMDRNSDLPSPRSPRPAVSEREAKPRVQDDYRNGGYTSRRDDDRRKRSRSPREKYDRRSRSPRDRGYRDRERGSDRNTRDGRDRHERERSRSKDRHRSSRGTGHTYMTLTINLLKDVTDHKSERRRSRSPVRNGHSTPSSRARTPPGPRSRPKQEERDVKLKDIKPTVAAPNGTTTTTKTESKPEVKMDVDDPDDPDQLIKKMMGFSTFKTTQNTKVPGNQIYGVRKEKKTEYRQYMNRVGGFNRPLDEL